MIYCKNCGKERPEVYKVCLKCGSTDTSYEPLILPEPPPNQPIINDKNCPKCGDERSTVKVGHRSEQYAWFHPIYLVHPEVQKSKDNWSLTSGILALVCNNCGFTEFYAEQPKNVLVKRPDKPVEE